MSSRHAPRAAVSAALAGLLTLATLSVLPAGLALAAGVVLAVLVVHCLARPQAPATRHTPPV